MSTQQRSILESIRQKVWLIITVIALSLLALVIDPSSLTNFSFQSKDILGKVNGTKILVNQFNETLEAVSQNPQYQNFPKNMLSNQVWNQLVQKTILNDKFEKLGLVVTDELIFKYLSQDPEMKKNIEFIDAKGNFSTAKFESWISNKQELAKSGNQEALQIINNWNQTKINLKDNIISSQYLGMVASGLIVNNKEVEFLKNDLQKKATINYVKIPYQEHISKVGKITDEEIEEYINENKEQFKVKENRGIGYVLIKSEPTNNDIMVAQQNMGGYINGKIEKIERTGIVDTIQAFSAVNNDSLYVITHSEQPFNSNYLSLQQIPQELHGFVKSAGNRSVSPLTRIQNVYVLSKIIDKKSIVDSIEVSHILIGHSETAQKINSRSKEEAKALSNSILSQVKANPSKFYELLSNSDDKGSIQTGGKYIIKNGENQFVPEFISFGNNNSVGTISIIESQFGYHIMKVDRKSIPSIGYKLANIIKTIPVSAKTKGNLYKQATMLLQEGKGRDLSFFANSARKKNLKYFLAKEVEYFGSINNLNTDKNEDIIKWSFNNDREIGDLNLFTTSNEDYVVTYLSEINEKGLQGVNNARERVEPILKNKKVAKLLSEEINKLGKKDINSISNKYKKQVLNSEIIIAANFVGSDNEPKVVGKTFRLKNNKTSPVIEGNSGIFITQLLGTTNFSNFPNDEQIAKQIEGMNKSSIQSLIGKLIETADIDDRRMKILQ